MQVMRVYNELRRRYGQQGWWPLYVRNTKDANYGIPYKDLKKYRTPFRDPYFEIAVGAILTQNTAWKNVVRAIETLYHAKALTPKRLLALHPRRLQTLIRPAGYFRQKAKKLRLFSEWLAEEHKSDILRLKKYKMHDIRYQLLQRWGIGKETADSILLYALNKPIFVVDEYTRRFCRARGKAFREYDDYRLFFESALPRSSKLFQEYHALLVACGKNQAKISKNQLVDIRDGG